MKLIFKGTIALLLIAASLFAIESCTKTTAQSQGTGTATYTSPGTVQIGTALRISNGILSAQINRIVFIDREITGPGSSVSQIVVSDYDGGNAVNVNPALPPTFTVRIGNVALSPDGGTVFFEAKNSANTITRLYSCPLNGSPLSLVKESGDAELHIGGAY